MLFRNAQGKLIELNKYDYKNDHIYYKKIMQLKDIAKNTSPKDLDFALDSPLSYSKMLIENAIANSDATDT